VSEAATAYHEAGHAVARWEFGLRVRRVSIVPSGASLGHVSYPNLPLSVYEAVECSTPTPAQLGRIERELIATLAGPEAEKQHTGSGNTVGRGMTCGG
jgi:hypothetical protein